MSGHLTIMSLVNCFSESIKVAVFSLCVLMSYTVCFMTLSDWIQAVQTFCSAKLIGFIQPFIGGRNQHCSNRFDILGSQANQIDLSI